MKKNDNKSVKQLGHVYMITNPTGRVYVGSSKNIEDRWRKYRNLNCLDQPKLYNSFKKYGVENHIFEIVWSGDILDMLKYEYLIGNYFDVLSSNVGMNCKLPLWGENLICYSKETLEKMRDRMTGNKNPMFGLKGEFNPNYGRKNSEESKKRMSESQKGKRISEEQKLKQSIAMTGKKHTEEARKKMSINNAKYWQEKTFTEEHRKKISAALKGGTRNFTAEHKDKIRKALLGSKQTPENKLKSQNAANKAIIQLDLDGNFIKEWKSITAARKDLNLKSSGGIIKVCKGTQKSAGNYKWKYKTNKKMNIIKDFITQNNLSFKEGSRNSSCTVLIGFSQYLGLQQKQLEEELKNEISLDKFLQNEINRLWEYCLHNNYGKWWEKEENRKTYKL